MSRYEQYGCGCMGEGPYWPAAGRPVVDSSESSRDPEDVGDESGEGEVT